MTRRFKNLTLVFFLHLTSLYCSVRSVEQCESSAVECPVQGVCDQSPDCCFSMKEEKMEGQVVGNVNVVTLINDILTNGSGSISQQQNEDEPQIFNLNTTTGEVRVTQRVDRDEGENHCITITIRVQQQSGSVSVTTVGVIVEDLNDNAPMFNSNADPYRTREGLNLSLCIGTYPGLEATDIDSAEHSQISYSLEGEEASKFEINNQSCIVNKVELDREAVADPSNTPEYRIQLTLRATDGELVSNNTLPIIIIITDINDNPPIFTGPSLETVEVREDEEDGVVIRDLNATDLDYNNTLRFHLQTTNVPFDLNESTGKLSLVKGDDFSLGTYTLAISVSDDMDERMNSATLVVKIQDVNDKANIILILENSLIEEMGAGGLLLRYRIRDDDTEPNTYLVELLGSHIENFAVSFHISDRLQLIEVVVTHPVDQEEIRDSDGNSTIELVIDVEEIGPYINYTHQLRHTIDVVGINDNLPFINKTEFDVPENSETKIGDLEIIDRDSGINGTIASSCVIQALAFSNSSAPSTTDVTTQFKNLNPCNQTTLISPPLDRDKDDIALIIVTMNLTDGGGRSNSANITVNLRDINDNCPTFSGDILEIKFNEGEQDGVQGSVTASDADSGPNARVEYELLNHKELFSVDNETGEIKAKGNFDREDTNSYAIEIQASNLVQVQDSDCQWGRTVVMVTILDLNDSPPEWENTVKNLEVFSDSTIGTLVITLTAIDPDEISTIMYSIEPNDLFKIEENTGVISVAADLSEKIGTYDLTATATDEENPPITQNITIEVTTPATTAGLSQQVIIGSTVGLCVLLVIAILVTTAVILYCVYLEKRKQSLRISKRNGRSEIDGVNSPARGILRQIPSSASSGLNGRTNSATSGRGVKFEKTVQKYGYDYGPDVYVTQSAIHLDSSGDESPVTPSHPPTAPPHHHHQHNGKLPVMGRHAHTNGGPRLSPIHEDTLFPSYLHRPHPTHPMQDDYSDDSEGNSEDDESTLPDNASSTNAPLPNTRHLSHMASSPRSTPPNSHLGPHLPMAQISPPHQFTRSPDHGSGLNPPQHIDDLSVHSSSTESLTPTQLPGHPHISHENQRLRPPGRSAYPVHMPEGYVMPPSSSRYGADPFMGRYGGTDFGDASTYTSADLDDALHFNPDQEPGIFSLTATSSYDEESQL